MSSLEIRPGQHALIVGQTGSGKSELRRALANAAPRVIVIDPKDEISDADLYTVRSNKSLERAIGREDRIRCPLTRDHYADRNQIEEMLSLLLDKARGYMVQIDELYLCIRSAQSYPPSLGLLYTQGRSRKISTVGLTQRPVRVPLVAISESTHYYKFRLSNRDDQKRMAEYMGKGVIEPENYPEESVHSDPHSYFYCRQGDRPCEFLLNLGG